MEIADVRPISFWNGRRNTLVVVVETDNGLVGLGEAGIGAHLPAITGVIETVKPWLVGQDATRIEHIWQYLFRGGFFPGGTILSAAVSAIDIALWDLNAQALGVPLYRLLGGRFRDRVPAYCHIGEHALAGVVESAQAAVAEGWRFVRWGIPQQGERHEPTPSHSVGALSTPAPTSSRTRSARSMCNSTATCGRTSTARWRRGSTTPPSGRCAS